MANVQWCAKYVRVFTSFPGHNYIFIPGISVAVRVFGFIEGEDMFKNISFYIMSLIALVVISARPTGAVTVSPSLEKYLGSAPKLTSDTMISVVVFADGFQSAARASTISYNSLTNLERHERVISELKNSYNGNLEYIKSRIKDIYNGATFREFWIAPAVAFDIPISRLNQLIDIPGIAGVYENGRLEAIEPVDMSLDVDAAEAVRGHLTAMNIPSLWARGYNGRGRLVCNFDTGVDGDHEALQAHWRGNTEPSSSCWFAPHIDSDVPQDNMGHGTQTMGIMLGSTPTDTFGVAPAAEWIAAAVIDQGQTLEKTFADIIAAFQWAIDPDGNPSTNDDVPDVIVNSWGVPTTIMDPCDDIFNQVIDNIEAAGVVTVFAAGNEGPEPYSLRLPANRASGPLNAFAVGAIDHTTNTIAAFSSRGPSSCDSVSIKPEIVAPGVGIYTSYKGGTYRFTSGTSMAAPVIAGLVAIMRQYNPDATVEEIKTALINSCQDRGPSGEDNTYGHGLPDASVLLSYLPAPSLPEIHVLKKIISGDGLADPGETFDLFLRIETGVDAFDSLAAYLGTNNPNVELYDNYANFVFTPGSSQTVNINPFNIGFDASLINGEEVDFKMTLNLPGGVFYDTLHFTLTVGTAPNGILFTHNNGTLEFTVSDFGLYGMAENSIYPAGGRGVCLKGSENLLYEAGIIVGRSSLQLSSAVRDSAGSASFPDFSPIQSLTTAYPAIDGGFESRARYIDTESPIPIPITINQKITSYDGPDDDQYLIFRYYVVNNSIESVTNLHFGFLADFDLSKGNDQGSYIEELNLYAQNSPDYAIGIRPLIDNDGTVMIDNIGGKKPLTQSEKYALINTSGVQVDNSRAGDLMSLQSFGPFNLAPFDSVEIALAVAVGKNLSEIEYYINRAAQRFNGTTDASDDNTDNNLPYSFHLDQNYPNPFNPSTTISFSLDRAADVQLDIINSLGRKIVTIYDGVAYPGENKVVWNGTDRNGSPVASGVYFYRLKTDARAKTRKMMLLK